MKVTAVMDGQILAMSVMVAELMDMDWWKAEKVVKPASPVTEADVRPALSNFYQLFRCGFTHLMFSQIETTLRALLRALDPISCKGAKGEFQSVYECLLRTHLKGQNWSDGIELLVFFRTVRNLMHNNGLLVSTRGSSTHFIYRGRAFDSTDGTHANFLPLELIIEIATDLLVVLEKIVRHPVIAGLPSVRDPVLQVLKGDWLPSGASREEKIT